MLYTRNCTFKLTIFQLKKKRKKMCFSQYTLDTKSPGFNQGDTATWW